MLCLLLEITKDPSTDVSMSTLIRMVVLSADVVEGKLQQMRAWPRQLCGLWPKCVWLNSGPKERGHN